MFQFASIAKVAGALALASAVVAPTIARAGADDPDLSALLKRQTQAFSEAGQRGDAAVIDRTLDPDVVFTNETGGIGSKQDILDSTQPPPAGAPKRTIEVTNWVLRRQGDVATATFIDVVTQVVPGQTLTLKFQSTETWAKRPDGWKMIASHTMNVQKDPPETMLSAAELEAYVGTYELYPGFQVRIRRAGNGLTASANGAAFVPSKAELRDVLFTPGVPNVRKIFQRDAAGRITGYINRRDGADLVLKRVG
jgi:hypothetical protein